jgi:hypothetical protein
MTFSTLASYAPFSSFPGLCKCHKCARRRRTRRRSIHSLHDDSLLYIFSLCQPVLLDEISVRISQGGNWDRERWWYKLAHVCQRWRTLILAFPNHLGLNFFCTYGTPVADMLAHSLHCPLVLDYRGHNITQGGQEIEQGIMPALTQHDRVRRIRLELPFPKLQTVIEAMNKEFPILDFLHIAPPHKHTEELILPGTFRAPHLLHLTLLGFSLSTISPFLATIEGIVTLSLQNLPRSAYFSPDDLIRRLPGLPQLATLTITFQYPVSNHVLGMKLEEKPITTRVILPNLRWFWYGGVSTYLEALLSRMDTPRLEWLQLTFFHQISFRIPKVLEFVEAAQNLVFGSAEFEFSGNFLRVLVYPHSRASIYAFAMQIPCKDLDWQVASAVQVFCQLKTKFSAVEYLRLEFTRYPISTEANNEADRIQWRKLFGTFSNVKTLRVGDDYLGQISRALQGGDEGSQSELFPELGKLEYYASDGNPFTSFADARKNVGHPVTLVNLFSKTPTPSRPFQVSWFPNAYIEF